MDEKNLILIIALPKLKCNLSEGGSPLEIIYKFYHFILNCLPRFI